jgi:diaminohydroxyphosphoribosylaminopyrimidine deaminase/5-amino-6-(5-phosphoribosylamino)uracil reductase
MVGAVLVKSGAIVGSGWHRAAGKPHAEIEALRDAQRAGHSTKGATLYVTLEPCSTHGRTPPCTDALIAAGVGEVVVAAADPNPLHLRRGLRQLARAGIAVKKGLLSAEALRMNEPFNHWIVTRTPFVTVKAAMTLDGKIATSSGESKWITNSVSRRMGMQLRQGADGILVGVNTIIADNPSLTVRTGKDERVQSAKRRLVLDPSARTPLSSRVLSDEFRSLTTIVLSRGAPAKRVEALARRANILVAPLQKGWINLRWLLKKLGSEGVTSLLVEGGGEVNASFLFGGFAHRIAFFYAPKVLGGARAVKAVAGQGAASWNEVIQLHTPEFRRLGEDLFVTASVTNM